jgi:hypothetical protein
VSGLFTGIFEYGALNISSVDPNNAVVFDFFVSKLDKNLNRGWIKTYSATGSKKVRGMAMKDNKLYCRIFTNGNSGMLDQQQAITMNGSNSLLIRCDSIGNNTQFTVLPATVSDANHPTDFLHINPSNNIVMGIALTNNTTFQGGTTFNIVQPSFKNALVLNFTPSCLFSNASNNDLPVAYFNQEYGGCINQTLHFQQNAIHQPTQFQWTFNGGNPSTSSDSNPQVSWSTPGIYAVQLVVQNANGSSTPFSSFVEIGSLPTYESSYSDFVCNDGIGSCSIYPDGNYQFLWSNGSTLSAINFGDVIGDTTFYVTITENNCSILDSFSVVVESAPNLAILSPIPSVLCNNDAIWNAPLTNPPTATVLVNDMLPINGSFDLYYAVNSNQPEVYLPVDIEYYSENLNEKVEDLFVSVNDSFVFFDNLNLVDAHQKEICIPNKYFDKEDNHKDNRDQDKRA